MILCFLVHETGSSIFHCQFLRLIVLSFLSVCVLSLHLSTMRNVKLLVLLLACLITGIILAVSSPQLHLVLGLSPLLIVCRWFVSTGEAALALGASKLPQVSIR